MRVVRWTGIIIIAEVPALQECYWSHLLVRHVDTYRHDSQFLNVLTVLLIKYQISEAVHRHQPAHIASSIKNIAALRAVLNPLYHFHHKVCVHILRMVQSPLSSRI